MNKSAFFFLSALLSIIAFCEVSFGETMSLPAGLQTAMSSNRLLKMGLMDEDVAKSDIDLAYAPTLPEVKAQAGYTMLSYPPQAVFGQSKIQMSQRDFITFGVGVNYTIYDFGLNNSRYEISKLGLDGKRIDSKKLKNAVAIDFTIAYFDLLESERMADVAENEAKRLTEHVKNAESRYKLGTITKNDLLTAQLKLSEANQRLLTARNIRLINAARLNNILGRPLTTIFETLDIKSETPLIPALTTDSAWVLAENHRPEFESFDVNIKGVDFKKTMKNSELYPRVFLRGGYDYTENEYQVHPGQWSLTLGVSLSIYSGGSTKAEIAKIEKQHRLIEEQKNRFSDEVRLQIESSLLNLTTAVQKLQLAKESVVQSRENLRVASARFTSGAATAADVLDASAIVTMAEANYFRSLYDIRRAEAGVFYAIGKDFMEVYK